MATIEHGLLRGDAPNRVGWDVWIEPRQPSRTTLITLG